MGTTSERLKEKTGTTERESGRCLGERGGGGGETRERVNGNVPHGEAREGTRWKIGRRRMAG